MNSRRLTCNVVLATALCVLALTFASPSGASKIPVRTGSGYGGVSAFSDCETNIVDFLNTGSPSACEGFDPGIFTINGVTFNGGKFAFLSGVGTDFGVLDVFTLDSNSSLTLSLMNFALPTGVFLCDKNTGTEVVDSSSTPKNVTNVCTTGVGSGSSSSADFTGLTSQFTLTGVTFTTTDAPFVLFVSDGNIIGATFTEGAGIVSAPEPGSLALLGTGIVALWAKFGRRKQA
jgi:hypothetical protein